MSPLLQSKKQTRKNLKRGVAFSELLHRRFVCLGVCDFGSSLKKNNSSSCSWHFSVNQFGWNETHNADVQSVWRCSHVFSYLFYCCSPLSAALCMPAFVFFFQLFKSTWIYPQELKLNLNVSLQNTFSETLKLSKNTTELIPFQQSRCHWTFNYHCIGIGRVRVLWKCFYNTKITTATKCIFSCDPQTLDLKAAYCCHSMIIAFFFRSY